ncbi:alpha/beta-hydrolase [Myriangium duriaei CBS 260.36]|uniref:Alpha/beta-hydrolase n=1 Tax=Myriangium duriaei CBS 260.36 TaxID=1168546 RepID=A0A9P4J094_9PEZI|nr:alpha/beta-hydrolase [Myriangium duriaei CBS 260.36]
MSLNSSFHFQGWEIRYNVAGPDKPSGSEPLRTVVFVHGTPWSSVVYEPINQAILATNSYRTLLYDLPGYGQSQKYNSDAANPISAAGFVGDTSFKFQAKALAALLEHVRLDGKDGNPRPAVVGHDIAGAIILRAHLLHNCDFESMLFADTNTVLPWGDGFYKLARSQPEPFLKLPPNIFQAMVRAVIQSACHHTLEARWEDALALPWSSKGPAEEEAQKNFVRQIAQANDDDVEEMLTGNLYEGIRCDIKVLWGAEDTWIPKEKLEELSRRSNGKVTEIVVVPEAGHLLMLDQPARFAVEVFTWLTGLRDR